jgi:hypothetical protein
VCFKGNKKLSYKESCIILNHPEIRYVWKSALICSVQYLGQQNIITIYVPLILKVREIIFFAGKTYNGAFRWVFVLSIAKGNFQVKKRVEAPSKTPKFNPLYILPQRKKILSRTFKISGTLVFLCPKDREREREREGKRERGRECEEERERKRERERES